MLRKTLFILSLVIFVNMGFTSKAHANLYGNLTAQQQMLGFGFNTSENWSDTIQIKRGEPYDEKKDPALRKGTENEEMPQSSFFAIPALIIGIGLVFLFFNRD